LVRFILGRFVVSSLWFEFRSRAERVDLVGVRGTKLREGEVLVRVREIKPSEVPVLVGVGAIETRAVDLRVGARPTERRGGEIFLRLRAIKPRGVKPMVGADETKPRRGDLVLALESSLPPAGFPFVRVRDASGAVRAHSRGSCIDFVRLRRIEWREEEPLLGDGAIRLAGADA
jgi:hypothetical protein